MYFSAHCNLLGWPKSLYGFSIKIKDIFLFTNKFIGYFQYVRSLLLLALVGRGQGAAKHLLPMHKTDPNWPKRQ